MMLSMLLPAALCALVALLTVLSTAAMLRRHAVLAGGTERWLAASAGFVVGMNLTFGVLSLLPLEQPLRLLALPVHLVLLAGLLVVAGRRALWGELVSLAQAVHGLARELGPVGTFFMLILLGVLGIYAWHGMITIPLGVDEMSYHAPQAIGMVQEGRLHSFDAQRPWVLGYPTGAAVLWAWTMLFTGGDLLFRLVQVGFALQLVLGAALLARRSGADAWGALLVSGVIITMPIFYRLVTTVGADLGYNAGIILALAFLAPTRNAPDPRPEQDLAAAVLAISQAVLIKIPVTALLAFGFGFVAFLFVRIGRRSVTGIIGGLARHPLAWGFLILPLICAWTYWLNWISHGNPFYPLTLRVAGTVIFVGPLRAIEEEVVAHSTFGPVAQMSALQRWHGVFADWFQPINEDAFGGPGAIFLVVVLFAAVLAVAEGLRQQDIWRLALGGFCLVTLAIPASFLPRYSLAWLCILAALAGVTFTAMRKSVLATGIVVAGLLIVFLYVPLREVQHSQAWLAGQAAPTPLWQDRGRAVFERIAADRRFIPAPDMLRTLRRTVTAGETLAYSEAMHPYLMWNNDYSNRIRFVPQYPADTWLATIGRLYPEVVLVSAESNLGVALVARYPEYRIVYSDSLTGDPAADRFNMVLLRR